MLLLNHLSRHKKYDQASKVANKIIEVIKNKNDTNKGLEWLPFARIYTESLRQRVTKIIKYLNFLSFI